MNILYGVQATGNGHISRSREMVKALKAHGHDVKVLFSGRSAAELWDVEDFKPYDVKTGFTFNVHRGRIRFLQTALKLKPVKFFKDIRSIETRGIDLVITDYEPVTAYLARRRGIFSIGIGHQYAFGYNIPVRASDPGSRAILRYFAPASLGLGLHWDSFGQPVLPPIVPSSLNVAEALDREPFYLVYLGFEKAVDYEKIFLQFPDHQFRVYSSEKDVSSKVNIVHRPFSRENFINDLLKCQGVICNAGFELPSEALHIGKKILVKPLKFQMEQESNAAALEILGRGLTMKDLSNEKVQEFLSSEAPEAADYPDVAGIIADWIGEGNFSNIDALVRQTWDPTFRLIRS